MSAMSSLPAQQDEKPVVADTTSSQPPRKRRRRAAATGATEDCFTCRKRQTKCDRRRPYCTQCLDLGKDCSGYRTTLTWGVGVASRGKLRGLSLPVAKAVKPSSAGRDSNAKASSSAASNEAAPEASQSTSIELGGNQTSTSPQTVFGASCPEELPTLQLHSPAPIPVHSGQHSQLGWHVPGFHEHVHAYTAMHGKPSRAHVPPRPLQRLQTSIVGKFDENSLSNSAGSVSAFSDYDFPSPDFPHTPDEFPFEENMFAPFPDWTLPHASFPPPNDSQLHGFPRSYPSMGDDMSSSISSDQSIYEYTDASPVSAMGPMSSSGLFYDEVVTAQPDSSRFHAHGPVTDQNQLELSSAATQEATAGAVEATSPLARTMTFLPTPYLQPRTRFLLDYYERAICPVLVAFDSPMNPYRMHILPLAMHNEALQNAIGALAVNNMRMRGFKEAAGTAQTPRASKAPSSSEYALSELTPQEVEFTSSQASQEETGYKATSIKILNSQLKNASAARDDSVLATLLILCLFHACDSGFSKFKTQLAGVQKLLSMRTSQPQSGFIGWIEMFFTWFDVMTSTVNDRESQIRGDSINLTDLSANLGALEHLSGCEGRLFKIIARLGRLNLLSQNRPVSESQQDRHRPTSPLKRKASLYDRLDGNGWGTPLSDTASESSDSEDPRQEFWTEWHDIRTRLQEWEMDPPSASTPSPRLPTPTLASAAQPHLALTPDQRDLVHISESFRYAALLYTERLAHPSIPSSALNIQNLVNQALFHISQIGITSCVNKFLLWPLFVAGAECVDDGLRTLVRKRCVEIQRESGFFNNLSSLDVLERVWQDDQPSGTTGSAKPGRHAFKWRKAMDRVDGEYIVV